LWVCAFAFLVADEKSIYSAQVESRSRSPAHQGSYAREVLAGMKVASFVTPLAEVSVLQVIDCLAQTSFDAVPVVDAELRLLGW
jgi:hypothetical protein